MALTPAEKQKAYRERKKAQKKKDLLSAGNDSGTDLYIQPFSVWAQNDANIGECDMYMALAGMEFPAFTDERNPHDFVVDRVVAFGDEELFGGASGALGRAEVVMGCLLDTAVTLSNAINRYKQDQIKQRLTELETAEDVDRSTAMQEAVRLNEILDQLNGQIRMPFPQWKVTGV